MSGTLRKKEIVTKITKFVHSCLLVEMPAPVNRTVLFDPGSMSESALDVGLLEYLDDIVITHNHGDHLSLPLVKALTAKFPEVKITTTREVSAQLAQAGVRAKILTDPSEGLVFFDAPHEDVSPMFPQPQEIGVHYLDLLTNPGDSHSFSETKAVLALPVQAPWGSMVAAVRLALQLKPQHILPIHDWHWNDDARNSSYDMMEKLFSKQGIIFHKLKTGIPVVLEVK